MRLIDADELISTIVSVESEIAKRTPYEEHLFSVMAKRQHEIIDIIADAPTIDAVEVVRCKDCKNWHEWENGAGSCNRSGNDWNWFGVDATDYCSFGEKR